MKRLWVWLVISLNLAVLAALVFIYPQWMVSPGPVIAAHGAIATDCFACHAPLRGASTERCITCHTVADIGLRTTLGKPVVAEQTPVAFHQELKSQNCMACHSDHADPKLIRSNRKPFSHELLRDGVRTQCRTCHKAPNNSLHRNVAGSCSQCHTQDAWKPATLDHDKLFVLDGDHNVECATCHVNNDYSRYTCYGCHEHSVEGIRRKHRKERITDLDNCVRCHKSADGEGGEGDD